MVVASAVNDKGEEIYPVKWNHDFMDLPEVKDQRTPVFFGRGDQQRSSRRLRGSIKFLYALLAGTGLRIEEAFALQVEDIRDTLVIRVRHRHVERQSCTLAKDRGRAPRGGPSIIRWPEWLSC